MRPKEVTLEPLTSPSLASFVSDALADCVPSVYLASATSPDFAILTDRGINNLRGVNATFSSIPAAPPRAAARDQVLDREPYWKSFRFNERFRRPVEDC